MLDVIYRDYYHYFINYVTIRLKWKRDPYELVNKCYLRCLNKELSKPIDNPKTLRNFIRQELEFTKLHDMQTFERNREDSYSGNINGTTPETPETLYASEEMKRVLLDKIAMLPPKCKQAVTVMMYNDSFKEAADFLSVHPVTLRLNFNYGCKQLRPHLELCEKDTTPVYFIDNIE